MQLLCLVLSGCIYQIFVLQQNHYFRQKETYEKDLRDAEVDNSSQQRLARRFGNGVAAEENEADHHNHQTGCKDCGGLLEVVRK